jgi:hypothetical protein
MRPIEAAAVVLGGSEHTVVVKTTRITIETDSLLVVYRGRTFVAGCPVCCADVEAMTLEGNSLGEEIPCTLLRDWLATGKLHFWSPDGGPAQICLPSLLQCFESEDARRLTDPKRTFPKTGEGK